MMKKINYRSLVALALLAVCVKAPRAAEERSPATVASDATSARTFSSPMRPGSKQSVGKPVWGKEVNGLQLGISFPDRVAAPYQVQLDQAASLYVVARNNSKAPIKLEYSPASLDDACNGSFTAQILDTMSSKISAKDVASEHADVCIYSAPVEVTLAPGAVRRLWSANFKANLLHRPAAAAAKSYEGTGEYRIGYTLECKKEANGNGVWNGKLETGQLAFEVVRDAKQP